MTVRKVRQRYREAVDAIGRLRYDLTAYLRATPDGYALRPLLDRLAQLEKQLEQDDRQVEQADRRAADQPDGPVRPVRPDWSVRRPSVEQAEPVTSWTTRRPA